MSEALPLNDVELNAVEKNVMLMYQEATLFGKTNSEIKKFTSCTSKRFNCQVTPTFKMKLIYI